jgi:RNA polymerase sigma factor (sigma-70 family)
LDEQVLIQALRLGDEQAFHWLVENYRNRVYHTVLNMLQDGEEAEDATQEVFIQVYESVGQFRQDAALSTWIYRIAVRKALDKLRRKKTRQQLQKWLPGWMPQEKKNDTTGFEHPGIQFDNKEKAGILFKAISKLPAKQQLAFTLIKVQGMNYADVSAIMEQGIKAIESLVDRAKKNLQQELQSFYNDNRNG